MPTVEFQVKADLGTVAESVGAECSQDELCEFVDIMLSAYASRRDYETEEVSSAAEALRRKICQTELELVN